MSEFLRIGGRGEDGLAKALKTNNSGSLYAVLDGSKSRLLSNFSGNLVGGASSQLISDASSYLTKSLYLQTQRPGYVGIEVEINGEWFPYLPVRNQYLVDYFDGQDKPLNSVKWEITKMGGYNENLTYAKVLNNQLELGFRASSLGAQLFVTSKEKVNVTTEKTLNFTIDETEYPVGTAAELNLGLTPTKPTDTASIAGRVYLFRIRENELFWASGDRVSINPKTNASYTIEFNPMGFKVYREGVLVSEEEMILDHSEYHLYIQLTGSVGAATRTARIGEIVVWSPNEDAKINGGNLWVRSTSDAMPSRIKLIFQNELHENYVDAYIVGQP